MSWVNKAFAFGVAQDVPQVGWLLQIMLQIAGKEVMSFLHLRCVLVYGLCWYSCMCVLLLVFYYPCGPFLGPRTESGFVPYSLCYS